MGNIVFVELNPYLSRLHVLKPLIEGASRQHVVHLVMSTRDIGEDLEEFLSSIPNQVQIHTLVSHVSANGQVGAKVVVDALRRLRRLFNSDKAIRLVIWTAIDDYMSSVPLVALTRLLAVRGVSLVVIRYRIEDLLAESRLWIKFKKAVALTVLTLVGTTYWIFDERVPLRRNRRVIVDPWDGPFSPRSGEDEPGCETTVLLVGRQDERKGFGIAAAALLRANQIRPDLAVRIIGRVDDRYLGALAELRAVLGVRFSHETRYLSDMELAGEFRRSRGVLMPYAPSFLGTSGVLVRAAASGVPVIGPRDGLIGYRINSFGLGLAVDTSRVEEVSEAVLNLLSSEFDYSSAVAFAERSRGSALSSWASANL